MEKMESKPSAGVLFRGQPPVLSRVQVIHQVPLRCAALLLLLLLLLRCAGAALARCTGTLRCAAPCCVRLFAHVARIVVHVRVT